MFSISQVTVQISEEEDHTGASPTAKIQEKRRGSVRCGHCTGRVRREA